MTQFDTNNKNHINKENAYELLKEFAKEYKRQLGKTPIEIIIVGGGSVMLNYSFREITQDIDVCYPVSADIKNVISTVSDRLSLDAHWMNSDFRNTNSYSPKLAQYSKHYCSFYNGIIEFRTINDEHLIAMKMMAMRPYRNDYSDIVGILYENQQQETPISYQKINEALHDLYDNEKIEHIPVENYEKIKDLCSKSMGELQKIYENEHTIESNVYHELLQIDKQYDGLVQADNVNEIVDTLKVKANHNASFVAVCGLPGSGKTDVISNLNIKEPYSIVSLSQIRKECYLFSGKRDLQLAIDRTEQVIRSEIAKGNTVLYDASNLHQKDRNHWLQVAKEAGANKCELIIVDATRNTRLLNCADHNVLISKDRMIELERIFALEYPDSLIEPWDKIETVYTPERELSKQDINVLEELNRKDDSLIEEIDLTDVINGFDITD